MLEPTALPFASLGVIPSAASTSTLRFLPLVESGSGLAAEAFDLRFLPALGSSGVWLAAKAAAAAVFPDTVSPLLPSLQHQMTESRCIKDRQITAVGQMLFLTF